MKNLKITLIQSNLFWEDKQKNLGHFGEKINTLEAQTDLIVLPEMFSTGFSMQPSLLAEPTDGPTIEWMKKQAKSKNAVVTGSVIIVENEKYYNRLFWVQPDGDFQTYDKRHLFTLANEHHYYAAGQSLLYTNLKGWKILPLICYDLRFPVWSRNTEDYDLLIYVANFPEKRAHAWKTLLQARAIENQAYTVGLNRVGYDGNDIYHSGDSCVLDYSGRTLYHQAHLEDVKNARLVLRCSANVQKEIELSSRQR